MITSNVEAAEKNCRKGGDDASRRNATLKSGISSNVVTSLYLLPL